MPIAPDRSHLADAIHLLEARQLIDAEVPVLTATVDRSRAAVASAKIDLDEHQRWLERHQELYSKAVKACERRLKRQSFIWSCKNTALLPLKLLATAWESPRRSRRAKLQNRIYAMEQLSGKRHKTTQPSLAR